MIDSVKFPFYAKVSLIFIGLFAFIDMLFIAQSIIVPLIYSIIIAIVLSPMVNYLTQKKFNKIIAILITVLSLIILVVLIALLLSTQMMQFVDSLPRLVENIYQLLDQLILWTSDNLNISTDKINLWLNDQKSQMLKSTSSFIGQTIINTGNVLVVLFLIPVYIFMILFYKPLLIKFIHKLFSEEDGETVSEILSATKKIIQRYLIGLSLEALVICILYFICLLLLGIDYAVLFAVMGAILNLIPYLGSIMAGVFPMILALVNKSPTYALLVIVSFTIIQFIDNNLVVPNIVASKVQINGLVSIIVVIAGGVLWGIPGMFLSIPLTAILKVIFDHIDGLKSWGFLLGDTRSVSSNKL